MVGDSLCLCSSARKRPLGPPGSGGGEGWAGGGVLASKTSSFCRKAYKAAIRALIGSGAREGDWREGGANSAELRDPAVTPVKRIFGILFGSRGGRSAAVGDGHFCIASAPLKPTFGARLGRGVGRQGAYDTAR